MIIVEHRKLPKSMMIEKALLSGLWARPEGCWCPFIISHISPTTYQQALIESQFLLAPSDGTIFSIWKSEFGSGWIWMEIPQEIPKKTNLCPSSDWFVRKITYLMVKTMVSCRLSLKPIQWVLFKTPKFRPRGFSSLPGAHHQANEADHSEAGGRQLRDFRHGSWVESVGFSGFLRKMWC